MPILKEKVQKISKIGKIKTKKTKKVQPEVSNIDMYIGLI